MKCLELSYFPLLNTKKQIRNWSPFNSQGSEKSSIEIGLMMIQVEKFTTAYLDTRGSN
jgi:hypothetical protein